MHRRGERGAHDQLERVWSRVAASQAAICILLAAAVFLCFAPALRNGFVGYDDPEYVTDNPHVRTGLTAPNVAWAFTTAHSSNWHPLTWISHDLDCELFGLDPAGHHLTSLLLHVANTLLLFLWLNGATGSRARAAWAALMFGLHPVHVESVAWVAERKDVLSTLFWMLTLLAYTAYTRKPGVVRYCVMAALFAAGLMSKPMVVTLPVVLLMLDWWPLGRKEPWGRLVWEKLPLLALSALASAAAVWAQRQGTSLATIDQLPLGWRLSNAALSYVRYLVKTAWPADLAAFYPFALRGIPPWEVASSLLLLAAASWLAFAARRRKPWVTVGWYWYVVTLLPVIGIVQVGMQAMADRYLYVPMIGLLIALTWECGAIRSRSRAAARLLPIAAGLVAAACAVLSWRQVQYWKDGVALFEHALEVTRDNFTAHDNLGVELDRRGRFEEALAQYRETLRIKPGDLHGEENYSQANFAKGERLLNQGAYRDALTSFQEGMRYRPRNALAHTYTGLVLTQLGRLDEATAEFRSALELDPTLTRAHLGWGVVLAQSGKDEDAGREFAAAVRSDPANVEARFDLGLVQASLGRNREALESFDAALRLKPDFGPAHAARAEALYAMARYDEAWSAVLAARAAHTDVDPAFAARLATRLRR
jgi:tetratricopeptide (TPR) repeat protein